MFGDGSTATRSFLLARDLVASVARAGHRLGHLATDSSASASDRRSAVETLAALGPLAASQVGALTENLDPDEDQTLRRASAKALKKIGRQARSNVLASAAPLTLDIARTTSSSSVAACRRQNSQPALDASVRAKGSPTGRRNFAHDGAASLPIASISSSSPDLRRFRDGRREDTSNVNKLSKEHLRKFGEALNGMSGTTGQMRALDWMAHPPKDRTKAAESAELLEQLHGRIAGMLYDAEAHIRKLALKCLGRSAAGIPKTSYLRVAQIIESDLYEDVRREAIYAVAKGGPDVTKIFMESLAKALAKDSDAVCRRLAITAFEELEMEAAEYQGLFLRALEDKDEVVRHKSAQVLSRMGQAAMQHLSKKLGDREVEVRKAAVSSLGRLGPGASEHSHAIGRLMGDEALGVRVAAGSALREILPTRAASWRAKAPELKKELAIEIMGELRGKRRDYY